MKSKILAKLVTKYPGLPKVFLGLIADKMAAKVTEESGIDEAITALDNAPIPITDLAAEFQKEGDRRVSTAKTEWEKKNPPKPKPGETEEDAEEEETAEETPKPGAKPKGERVPAWAKGLITEIQSLKAEKAAGTIKQKLAAKFSEKGKEIPELIWGKRKLPEKEEEIDAFEADVRADYDAFVKDNTEKGISMVPKPGGGQQQADDKTKASEAEVKGVLNNIMP